MRKTDPIHNLIKKMNLAAGPELDRRIDALIEQSGSRPLNTWSLIMTSPITRYAAAAVIIAAALAGLYKVTGSVDGSSVAWAQVVEQLNKHEKYKCRQRVAWDDGRKFPTMDVYHWNLSLRRQEVEDGAIHIIDMRHADAITVELYPDKKKAVVTKMLGFGPQKDPDIIDMVKRFEQISTERLGTRRQDGRTLVGFHHKPNEHNDFTVWVDAQTKLPVEIELKHPTSGNTISLDQFEFDFDLDISAFSTDVPAGYEIQTYTQDYRNPTPESISPEEIASKIGHSAYKIEGLSWVEKSICLKITDPLGARFSVYVIAVRADDGSTLLIDQSQYTTMNVMVWIPKQDMVLETNGIKFYTHPNGSLYAEYYLKALAKAAPDFFSSSGITDQRSTRMLAMPDNAVLGLVSTKELTDERLKELAASLVKIEPAN